MCEQGDDLPLRLQCTTTQAQTEQDDEQEPDPVPQEAAAPLSPPTNNAQDAHKLGLTVQNLSLQAVAEEDLWDDVGGDLEWDDYAGHEGEDGD